ncbi:MAG: DUF5658 family protein [Syntrophobacteraceae bacterium]
MNETQFNEDLERRSGKDRRSRPTSPFTIESLKGSRQHFRRKEDTRKLFFVDLYSPLSVAVLLFTLGLSTTDAFLTLVLVGKNVEELNPVMDFFLKLGPFQFIMAKWLLTAFGLTTLLILKNYYLWHGKVRAAVLLFIFPLLYLVLVGYEILLVMKG